MIFVDIYVFIYAVGRSHPAREDAQGFFLESSERGKRLVTSAEVLQELLHVYLPVGREPLMRLWHWPPRVPILLSR